MPSADSNNNNRNQLDQELFNRFLDLADKVVSTQTVISERLLSTEQKTEILYQVINGSGETPGILEKLRKLDDSVVVMQEKISNTALEKIRSEQTEILAQQKVILILGYSILGLFAINIIKWVIMEVTNNPTIIPFIQ